MNLFMTLMLVITEIPKWILEWTGIILDILYLDPGFFGIGQTGKNGTFSSPENVSIVWSVCFLCRVNTVCD